MSEQKDTVDFCRGEYLANVDAWRLVSDACAGQLAVKLRGEVYLPKPNPSDKSEENKKRYEQYLHRAVYYNATGRTLTGLVGLAFGKWPELKLPKVLDYIEEDADGAGQPLIQQAQATMGQILKTGRAGILVDFPSVEGGVSVADQQSKGIRATLNYYPAHSITNWRKERRGGLQVLTLVVLRETSEEPGDFSVQCKTQYRVLRLPADGIYVQEVWAETTAADGTKSYDIETIHTPLQGNGATWREIPFQFVGAVTNTPELEAIGEGFRDCLPDRTVSPLFDIAVLNLAHYRNSADYEDSTFLVGQPQPWMSGIDVEWRDTLIREGMFIGSRTVVPLPVGGAFGIAQAQPNTLVGDAMKQKEEMMTALGAKLIEKSTSTKTATQANHDQSKDNSVLSLVCDNVSSAYKTCLNWACRFMNAAETAEFNIDTEFSIQSLDGPSIVAVVQAWQAKLVPIKDAWSSMRKFGVIDSSKSDDEIQDELDAEAPTAGAAALLPPNPLQQQPAPIDPTKPPVPPPAA